MTSELRLDIAEARRRMRTATGVKAELSLLEARLTGQERVLHLSAAFLDDGIGLLALTTERLLYFDHEHHGVEQLFDWPFQDVRSIDWRPAMMTGAITVTAGANQYVFKNVQKDLGPAFVEDFRRHQAAASSRGHRTVTAPTPAPEAEPDVIDQIRRLSELHDQGIVTDQEFVTKKAELLSRL